MLYRILVNKIQVKLISHNFRSNEYLETLEEVYKKL